MNFRIGFLTILFCLLSSYSYAQTIKVSSASGGSVTTDLSYGIKVNKNSSLQRTWLTFNDPSCPVELKGCGILTKYDDDRGYKYIPTGSLLAKESISALDIRFILYDVFGDHIKTLAGTEVTDVSANSSFSLETIGSWRAWENEVSELLTVVSFVAQIRTESGKIWRYNDKAISEELNKVRLKISTGVLDPTKEKK